jgi:hypothetical protein
MVNNYSNKYQQNEQSPLPSTHWRLQKITIPDPDLGQTQTVAGWNRLMGFHPSLY